MNYSNLTLYLWKPSTHCIDYCNNIIQKSNYENNLILPIMNFFLLMLMLKWEKKIIIYILILINVYYLFK